MQDGMLRIIPMSRGVAEVLRGCQEMTHRRHGSGVTHTGVTCHEMTDVARCRDFWCTYMYSYYSYVP